MQLYDLLFALISGLAVGASARALSARVALWLSVLVAVAGSMAGSWIYVEVLRFGPDNPNIDWWQHGWQVAIACASVWLLNRGAALLPAREQRPEHGATPH